MLHSLETNLSGKSGGSCPQLISLYTYTKSLVPTVSNLEKVTVDIVLVGGSWKILKHSENMESFY